MQGPCDAGTVIGRDESAGRKPPARHRLTVRNLRDRFRARFLWGLPWGTVLLCCILIFVYLVVQGGLDTWTRPLTIPFTSWSYEYPTGVLLGPVAHQGPDHLLGNLIGVLVFGTLAEYVYGHKPPTGDTPSTNPVVRAFVIFPAGALLVGVAASAFSWGPTIGFSNVIYAFAGVALVKYPIGTVVALSARDALAVLVDALEEPLVVAGRRVVADPWFVDTAIQSHTFGLLLGVTVGVALISIRDVDAPPPPLRLLIGVSLFAFAQSLWALWWPQETAFVLARGPGLIFVACLALLLTTGAVFAVRDGSPILQERSKQFGFAVLLVPLAVMAGIAVPMNVSADASVPSSAETIDVDGYTLTYVEEVPNQRLAPFTAVTGEQTRTSGILVINPDRGIWMRAVRADRLARKKRVTMRLGGLGWDRTVFAIRRGWRTTGGDTTYQVWLNPRDGRYHNVYAAEPARAAAVIDGYNLSVVPSGIRFKVRVTRRNQTIGTASLPDRGDSVTLGGLQLRRDGEQLIAIRNQTRVLVAKRQ